MSEKRKYDSTVARIAGNIMTGVIDGSSASLWPVQDHAGELAAIAVQLARAIVAEVERTEPEPKA